MGDTKNYWVVMCIHGEYVLFDQCTKDEVFQIQKDKDSVASLSTDTQFFEKLENAKSYVVLGRLGKAMDTLFDKEGDAYADK